MLFAGDKRIATQLGCYEKQKLVS